MKGEQIGRKVREIKFPQYIISEKFEKNENEFYVFILEIWLFCLIVLFIFFKLKTESVFLFCLMGE